MAYLVPRDPFNISSLRRQMEEMFDQFFPFSGPPELRAPAGGVMIDVLEDDKEYLIKANVPGFSAKDVEVRVSEDGVTIKGNYNEEKEEKKQNYLVRERRSGSFQRTIALQHIDPDGAKAKFKDGVLELTVPKQDPGKRLGRQLEIEE